MAAAQEKLLASYRKAVAEHQEGNLDAALKSYRECLALQPIPAVHNNVAAIQLSQGHKRAAEESWRQAVSLKPDYAEAHYNLAVLLSESGQEGSLEEAASHCELALAHKDGYVQAHHLMGNIRMSQGGVDDAATWYARAEKLAGESAGAGAATGAAPARGSAAADASEFRWEGVEVGHVRRLQLPDGTSWTMETLSLRPLSFLVRDFLSDAECTRLVELALPQLKTSLVMGNATASERTSESVFLGAAEDELLPELQRRLAALAQLPLGRVQASEDLQVVHYTEGATFGMHHDSSSFLPRVLTAFYYLNDVAEGGETAFPAADNAMAPDDALKLTEPASSGGLVVKPQRGAALVWYNHDESGAIDPFAVHAGCRVKTGEKWGANHWVRAAAVRPQQREPAAAPGARAEEVGDAAETSTEAGARAEQSSGSGKNAAANRKKRDKEKAKKERARIAAASEAAAPSGGSSSVTLE